MALGIAHLSLATGTGTAGGVVVARWDGTQIRSEKGRLHNGRGEKSGPGRGRGQGCKAGMGVPE